MSDKSSRSLAGDSSERIFSGSLCLNFPAAFSLFYSIAAIICSSHFPFYLQADYNVIKRIDSGALRFLYKLRVLILNDNLIPVLPAHLFRFRF